MFCRFFAACAPLGIAVTFLLAALAALAAFDPPAGAAVSRPASGMISPIEFSPNGDSVYDTTSVKWILSAPAPRLFVRIRLNHPPAPLDTIRLVDLGARPAGPGEFIWDGRDDQAVLVAERVYEVEVAETNAAGDTLRSRIGSVVTVDVTPPHVPVLDPTLQGLDTTDDQVQVTGHALGAGRVELFRNDTFVGSFKPLVTPTDSLFAFDAGLVTLLLGANDFIAQAFDTAGNRSAFSGVTRVNYRNTTDVTGLRVSAASFSPNGDGATDSTSVSFELDAPTTRLEVQIRKAKAPPLQTQAEDTVYVRLHDAPADSGEYTFAWDGRDSTALATPEGGYFFFVRAESMAVNGAPLNGRPQERAVTLDVTAPGAPIVNPPLPARTDRNAIELNATATGSANIIVLQNGVELLPRSTSPLKRTVNLTLGSNAFRFQAVDGAGNLSPLVGPISVVRAEPAGFHASERFGRGDVFQVNLASAPRSLKIELRTLEGRLVRTLSSSSQALNQEIPWNLADDVGNTVGNGPYRARLLITYQNGQSDEISGAVVVVK